MNKKQNFHIYLLIGLFCLITMIITMLNETNIFYIVKNFIFNPEYRNNFTLAESNIKENISLTQVIIHVFSNYRWNFDYLIIFGTNLFQILLPIIVSVTGLIFYTKYNSIYKFALYRKEYKKYLLSEIFKESFKMSIIIFSSYMVYYILLLLITKGNNYSFMQRTLFLDILGQNFYNNHLYLYYLLDGSLRFLIIPFIYSMLACSISIICKTKKQVLLISNIYYYGMSMIGFFMYYIIGDNSIYLNPSVIMASGTYNNVHTIMLFAIHLVPIIISVLILERKNKSVEL